MNEIYKEMLFALGCSIGVFIVAVILTKLGINKDIRCPKCGKKIIIEKENLTEKTIRTYQKKCFKCLEEASKE